MVVDKRVKCIKNKEPDVHLLKSCSKSLVELTNTKNDTQKATVVTCRNIADSHVCSIEALASSESYRELFKNGSGSIGIKADYDKKKSKFPDGGYGWMVVFASFAISLISDGISFSFGLIFTELLSHLNESTSKTAMIGSLFLAVPLLSGPILSNLVNKYGCRKMTIIAGILAGSGFALASICTSVVMLYVTFGFISGLGIGIGYVTVVVSIINWFDNRRTFATSIGSSGSGIGTFLYAPFTQWLINLFGWRGATLVLAGTMFNICVCGCLMRDPDWLKKDIRMKKSQCIKQNTNSRHFLTERQKFNLSGEQLENSSKHTILSDLISKNQILNQNTVKTHQTSSCPNIYQTFSSSKAFKKESKWYDQLIDMMKSSFKFSLFSNTKFACFSVSYFLLSIWFIVPYFYITDHMLQFSYTEEDAANLIAVIGIFNTVGMLFLGFCGDQPWLNACKTYAICLAFCGLSLVLMPIFVQNYKLLMLTAILFGITMASSYAFVPIILARLVDLDDFTSAYGLVLLVSGVGNLIGPPLAGYIYEYTSRWDDSFYIGGVFISLSGAFVYVIAILEDRDIG